MHQYLSTKQEKRRNSALEVVNEVTDCQAAMASRSFRQTYIHVKQAMVHGRDKLTRRLSSLSACYIKQTDGNSQ